MSWNLEQKKVSGFYLGQFKISGTVVESRVKYGGKVCNTIVLDKPIEVFGSKRDQVLMNTEELIVA